MSWREIVHFPSTLDNSTDDVSISSWVNHPVVRRDRERFRASCGAAVLPAVRPVESLARVLVLTLFSSTPESVLQTRGC